MKQAPGLARSIRKPCVERADSADALQPTLTCTGAATPPRPHLPVRGGHEAQKLIHVAHSQPVHKQLHGRLHPLRVEEVPHHLGDPAASRPGPKGSKKVV